MATADLERAQEARAQKGAHACERMDAVRQLDQMDKDDLVVQDETEAQFVERLEEALAEDDGDGTDARASDDSDYQQQEEESGGYSDDDDDDG